MSKCWIPPNKKIIKKKIVIPEVISLSLVKTSSTPFYNNVGQNIIYTYTVTNTGNTPIIGPIVINDNKLGLKIINQGLLPGETLVTTMTYVITTLDVTLQQAIVNVATASDGHTGTASNVGVVVISYIPI